MKTTKFKQTELGPIPEDWEVKRLGEMIEKESARLQTGPFGTVLSASEFVESGHPVISVREIRTGYIQLFEETPCVSDETYKRLSKYSLIPNDLVFARKGSVDRSSLIPDDGISYFLGSDGICVRFDGRVVLPRFILYYFQSETARKYLVNQAYGTTMAGLNEGIMQNLLLELPPLPEQHRIAAALSDVDELISALGKLIEKKRNIKTGTMQQLLTGKRRLPGFEGTEFKQTDLGPIPSDWEVKRLGEVFSMLRNNTYARELLTDDGGKVFNVHYGDILVKHGAMVNFEMDEVPCLKAGIKPNKDMLQDGDLIFADTAEDEMVGKAVEVAGLKGRQAVAGLHTVLCRPNADTFAPGFLGYFINSASYHNQLLPLITGTKVSSVSRAGFASTYVCIPPLPEQCAIAAVLSDMDAEIAALEAEQAKYARIKSGMMQELLTGKTRLRETSSED